MNQNMIKQLGLNINFILDLDFLRPIWTLDFDLGLNPLLDLE